MTRLQIGIPAGRFFGGKTLILGKHGLLPSDSYGQEVELAFKDDILDPATKTLNEILDQTLADAEKIKRDTGLNAIGKTERLINLGNTSRKKVEDAMGMKRALLKRDLEQATKGMPTRLPTPGEYVKQEGIDLPTLNTRFPIIWQHCLSMGREMVTVEVATAAEQNDLEFLIAVTHAPKCLKLVGPDALQKATERWLELKRPDEYRKADTVKRATVLFEANITTAQNLIGQTCGVPLNDIPAPAPTT